MFLLAMLGCGGETIIYLTDVDNHTATRDLDIPVESVEPQTDWEINWSSVGSDLRCQKDLVAEPWLNMIQSPLTTEELQEKLDTNSLKQADQTGYVELELTGTCSPALASEMGFFGSAVDTETGLLDGYTYLLLFSDGGLGELERILSMAILDPATDSTSVITLEDGCGMLDVGAEFSPPVSLRQATVLDWSGLTTDALGNPLDPDDINTLQVGYFSDLSPEDLEADYFMLESLVTQRWEITVEGQTTVSRAKLAELDRFDVSDGNGTWLLSLDCSGCFPSTPLFLAVITE